MFDQFEQMMKTAKLILKKMSDAKMIANDNFQSYMANFLISDGEMAIAIDVFDDYFLVNDGDQEFKMNVPRLKSAKMKIYNLGLSFAKNHPYTVGLNA